MHKKMTITLDETLVEGLYRTVGAGKISQFIADLIRPHVLPSAMDDGYKAMAADTSREAQASAWINALSQDMVHEQR